MTLAGFGPDQPGPFVLLHDEDAQPCDLPGCRQCGNPVDPDCAAPWIAAHQAQQPARIGPALRYRLTEPDGSIGTLVYHELFEAVETAIASDQACTIYRETEQGDLLLLARTAGRKE